MLKNRLKDPSLLVELAYIDGQWVKSSTGKTFENRNPADVSEVIGTFPMSTLADVDRAGDHLDLQPGFGEVALLLTPSDDGAHHAADQLAHRVAHDRGRSATHRVTTDRVMTEVEQPKRPPEVSVVVIVCTRMG